MRFGDPTRGERVGAWIERVLAPAIIAPYVRRLGLRGDERLLEVGCGAGAVTGVLARAVPRGSVTAVDPSVRSIEGARRRLRRRRNVEFLVGDVHGPSLPANGFDAALLHYVLHEIPHLDRTPALARIAALLRPGGVLFVREPTRADHGIPASEVRALTAAVGLREASARPVRSPLVGATLEATYIKG